MQPPIAHGLGSPPSITSGRKACEKHTSEVVVLEARKEKLEEEVADYQKGELLEKQVFRTPS